MTHENETYNNENAMETATGQFSKEDLKWIAEKRKEEERKKMEAEAKAQKEEQFNAKFEAILNDPNVAPFKDLVEEVAKEKEGYKELGEAGVRAILDIAKAKIEAKRLSEERGDAPTVDDVPQGSKVVAKPKVTNEAGVPMREDNPNLIDWENVDSSKLDPVTREFQQRQIAKKRRRIFN
jgi:cobalamin biosynthesis protein CobT